MKSSRCDYTLAHGAYDSGLLRPDPPLGKNMQTRTVASDDVHVRYFDYLLAKEEAEAEKEKA